MPNTLAHIAVQTLATRSIRQTADFKWILLGCVLPDIPWIAQRVLTLAVPDMPAVALRLYAVVQSSLVVTLILAAALAFLSRRPGQTFAILASGALMHLLLDATQTKWANGALLFVPFSWDLVNFGLYWPESRITTVLSGAGLLLAVHALWAVPPVRGRPVLRPATRPLAAAALMLIWLALPVALMPGARAADLHFAATLDSGADRQGAPIAFDRARLTSGADGLPHLSAWTGEVIAVQGHVPDGARVVSLRGRFTDTDTIAINDIFVHAPARRAILSQIGLIFIAGWWLRCLRRRDALNSA